MRRPLCVFCAGMLGVALVCDFLPQTELFVPFAAFFVAVCLVLCIFDAARKAALCILLGAAVGMASVLHTANRLERIRVQYAGRPLVLTAEVESTADSYDPGIVDAVLHVEKVNGSAASFRVECSALPECKAGERVQGRFILSAPASGSRVSLYADGIALQAEMDEDGPELTVLGESGSFRARTHRLQQRLSASLRRRMDGKTGGVLAASNYPSYDQNLYASNYSEYSSDPSLPLFNRSLQGLYTPGSTFKPAVAVAALDSGLINQYSTVNCTGVYTYYKDYRPRCTQHGHSGNISVVDAIKWSCNIFFYDVGRRLTSDVYDAYAYKLGLAQRTGVEVSESLGRLTTKSDSNYTASLDVQAAIGQGNTVVSPIQLATYAATLANNGTRYRTHFVKAILDTNTGEVLSETKPEVMDVIEGTGNTFELVRQGMKQVPSTISGKISSYPVPIACKTGTPQRSETYASGKHYLNAMMVAYLPADDPQIAIGITIEYGGYGARTGDLVVDIANAYFALKDGSLAQQAEEEKEAEQAKQDTSQTDAAGQTAVGQTADTAAPQAGQTAPAAQDAAPEGPAADTAQPAVQDGPDVVQAEQNPDAIAPEN